MKVEEGSIGEYSVTPALALGASVARRSVETTKQSPVYKEKFSIIEEIASIAAQKALLPRNDSKRKDTDIARVFLFTSFPFVPY